MELKSVNPFTGEEVGRYPVHTPADVESRIESAQAAHLGWRRSSLPARCEQFRRLADVLESRKEELARLVTVEMGKRLSEAAAEIEKCVWACKYYSSNGARLLKSERVDTSAALSYVSFQPLGVVLAVMPWNFPFWQVFRCAVPILLSGNALLVKHAGNVTGCMLRIEDLFRDAGFPDGLLAGLLIPGSEVESVVRHPLVRGITLTGSDRAGKGVASAAGAVLKKTVLELGGSDAYLVLEDAPLDKTVEICAKSRFLNAGQSCISAKRFIVAREVVEEFTERFVAKAEERVLGDPLSHRTTLAPLARADLRDQLHDQVQRSLKLGARLLTGGRLPNGSGALYPGTVLTQVRPGIPAFDEEVFGPVASIITAESEAEAIGLANRSRYGLGAAVFTANTERGERIADLELQAGCCFVNQAVGSDPRLPFGGIKDSGYGRELSRFGLHEFVNIKTISVAHLT